MNVKKYVRALLCLYLTLIIAMDAVKGQSLKVGDTLPPELWSMPLDVINHPEGKDCITLGEYKDKLIILDFWATWCSPCIAMLPKQDSLQRQFKDKLQILPVTYQTGEEVSTFMEKYEKRKGTKNSLLKVVGDNRLRTAFPHMSIPHYVWIDKEGAVKAITGHNEVSVDKIAEFLSTKNPILSIKTDPERIPYDESKPFLINGNGGDGRSLLYHSVLSGYVEGLKSKYSMSVDSLGKGSALFSNFSLFWIYKIVYGADSLWIGNNRMEINLSDSKRFAYNESYGSLTDWRRENAYCYQILLPKTSKKELFSKMNQDLKRMFPAIDARIEQCERMCWVLSRIPGYIIPAAKPAEQKFGFEAVGYVLQNASIKFFVSDMDMMVFSKTPFPFLDETGFTAKLDMDINVKVGDTDALAAALESYGFRLTKEKRKISVLVINDKPVNEL